MIESVNAIVGTLLEPIYKSQNLICGVLASVLVTCRVYAVLRDYRKSQSCIGKDASLRIGWYLTMGAMSWLPTYLDTVRFGLEWVWYNDRIPFVELRSGYINAVLVALLARSCFSVRRSEAVSWRRFRVAIVGLASLGIMAVLLEDMLMLPGLITIMVLSMEISQPYVFRGFQMEPQGAHIHITTGALLDVVMFGFLILAVHCVCWVLWRKRRSRLRLGLMALTLLGAASIAWYADAHIAADLSPALAEFHVTRDFRRILAMIVSSLPVASIAAWSVLSRHGRNSRQAHVVRSDGEDSGAASICELVTIALLGLMFLLNFYYCMNLYMALGWFGRGLVFFHAMPLFACAFACGRWTNMHWSRDITAPTTYSENMSISATIGITGIIALQLLTTAMLTCWLAFIVLYLPLP